MSVESPVDARTLPLLAAVTEALDLALSLDDDVFLLGEDISDVAGGGPFRATQGLSTKHGAHRVRDTPISEQAIVGAAIGAAVAGMRPVAEIMIMDFVAVAMDQIANHAAKLRYMSGGQTAVPLTIRCSAGGGYQFGAQHSQMLEGWLAHTPGLKVAVPSNPADAKGLLLSCVFDDDPCVHVEQTTSYRMTGEVPEGEHFVPLGVADVKREGADVSVITYGREVNMALEAATELAEDGVDVEVVDLRSLVPLDEGAILRSVAKTKRALVVTQSVGNAGFSAELVARIHAELFGDLTVPVRRLTAPNTPVPYARELEQAFLPGPAHIVAAVRDMGLA